MRILFIGSVKFSFRALSVLIENHSQIVGVCTLKESKFNADHSDLTPIAVNAGIPVLHALNLHSTESLQWISKRNPDIVFCFGWSRILKASLLNIPHMGVVGYHPTALPSNRGRHPLIWALVLGLKETASTFFFMNEGVDSGNIISQKKVPINQSDDAACLYERVTEVAMTQLIDLVNRLHEGNIHTHAQDHILSNTWRKRGIVDGKIDWRMAAESIYNLVRGLSRPYVGAHFDYDNHSFKVWKTKIESDAPENIEPGKILSVDDNGIVIKAGIGAIRLIEYEPRLNLKPGDYL